MYIKLEKNQIKNSKPIIFQVSGHEAIKHYRIRSDAKRYFINTHMTFSSLENLVMSHRCE